MAAMSKTRNNHYVPQWYQEGFFEPGRNTLAYLDMAPPRKVLADGRVIFEKSKFDSPTARAFSQRDLYSTFFGTSVNDEIERRLLGDIDSRGARAIRAFAGTDVSEWHRHFQTLFEYIDIQKIRTVKGLDWLKAQYPALTQNELMVEMQGIQMMHCTIWSEGVREIISAEDAHVKFIISDHPVTIYNHAVPLEAPLCVYPQDPGIALKASQTIFPLNRNFCLIFANLEYAKNPSTSPLEKRTFARNYRTSMVRTDAFIRSRKLTDEEVSRVNYVIKARARRYIAAGRAEWLYPEKTVSEPWEQLAKTLLPPANELWHFGGDLFAKFEDGHVHYQDAFGRTEKERDFLKKDPPITPLRPADWCGCGSGRTFKVCCKPKPTALRPTWNELSIRERNLMLYNGIVNILGLKQGTDWVSIRRNLSDDQISKIYFLYQGLWPLETDLLQLLPKPDGTARAVYTGPVHPTAIAEVALGASLYFGELIIQHPFVNAATVKKEFSPVENPTSYRQEFLKTVLFFLTVMPLVERGLVNLIPDPCDFDVHLRGQVWRMANARSREIESDLHKEPRLKGLIEQDARRALMSLPGDVLKSQLLRHHPKLGKADLDETLRGIEQLKEQDPLAVLQPMAGGKEGGQFSVMKLAPNFEMAMYLAQATGSCIVTDSLIRWNEVGRTIYRRSKGAGPCLSELAHSIKGTKFAFPQGVANITVLASEMTFAAYPALMRDIFKYLSKVSNLGIKPNVEANLNARFARAHFPAQAMIKKARMVACDSRISCAFPAEGIQDNTVNRLLLMSSSERHLPSVPMAFLIEGQTSSEADQTGQKN
jgi:hypothetical protein